MRVLQNSFFAALTAFALLTACTPKEKAVQLSSGLRPENMDTTVKPGDNFQMYVNGTWIKNTEIPADKSRYGIMHIVHEQSQVDVRKIIEEAASAGKPEGTDEQKLGDLFASFMDSAKREELGVKPLAAELKRIEEIKSLDDLSAYFGYASSIGFGTPVRYYVYPDLKNPGVYILYMTQSGLGLPEREYYFSKDEKSETIRKAYVGHVGKMLELAGFPNGSKTATEIMALETSIANLHMKKEETRDANKMYNNLAVDSLDKALTNFNIAAYLESAGAGPMTRMVVRQPSFITGMNDLIKSTSLSTWKNYLAWHLVHGSAILLNKAIDQENFDFYGKTLTGTKEPLPTWRRGVNLVNENLGEVVGKVYVERHFPKEAKDRMNALVGNLIGAYKQSITELDWMGQETKMQALDKLSKFSPKIGYPEKWRDYSKIQIRKDDLFGNIVRSRQAENIRQTERIGKPVDRQEWGMTPQTVNAYYNPPKNEIVFPAAILQPPYFNLSADDAVNYGAIGAVIGHEIGHGFDDQGSKFNGDGELKNWWTDKDREEFKKRTSALVAQYSEFKALKDLNVNGEFTLGENIGDLGGLSIALKAYKKSMEGKEDVVIDGYTGVQRVFLGWAQAWLEKPREEGLRVQINTDPHSPAKFRVNGVVRNIPEFYEAFNVQPGDSLYLAPEDRVKIW